jgi:hypothetical protein
MQMSLRCLISSHNKGFGGKEINYEKDRYFVLNPTIP